MTITILMPSGHHYRGLTISEEQSEVTNKNHPNQVVIITFYFIFKHLISLISLLFCHISVKASPYSPFKCIQYHENIFTQLRKVLYLLIKQQLKCVT